MKLLGKGLTVQRTHLFDINRRVTAFATQNSWKHAPHATYVYEPDITDFYEYYIRNRKQLEQHAPMTFTVIMLKVIGEALKKAPQFNALLHYNSWTAVGKLHILKEISIAIPWLLSDNRLITPIIHDVGEKSLREIADDLHDIHRRVENTDIDAMQYFVAMQEVIHNLKRLRLHSVLQIMGSLVGRNRVKISKKQKKQYKQTLDKDKITTKDIFEAGILFTNIGSIFHEQRGAVTLFDLISPQVFAVAINAIQERPGFFVTKNGEKRMGLRKILPLSLTIDHRALDGADYIPLQQALDTIFSNPCILDSW